MSCFSASPPLLSFHRSARSPTASASRRHWGYYPPCRSPRRWRLGPPSRGRTRIKNSEFSVHFDAQLLRLALAAQLADVGLDLELQVFLGRPAGAVLDEVP